MTIDLLAIDRQLLRTAVFISELQQKIIDYQKNQIEESDATVFDLQTTLDQQRIDTSADPKRCPHCGSLICELLCSECNKLFRA